MIVDEILRRLRAEGEFLTSLRRAQLEEQLYDLTDDVAGKKGNRGGMAEYLRKRYGLDYYQVKGRNILLNAGEAVTPLWQGLDGGSLLIGTALTILREARKRSRAKGTALDVEVEEGLMAWEDRTVVCKTEGGKNYKRRVTPNGPNNEEEDVRESLERIRAYALRYAERRMKTLDGHVRRRIVDEMMAEVHGAIASLIQRLERAERRARADEAVPVVVRREIVEACELLHVARPSPTKPLDMDEVNRRFKDLVKRYHPDVTGDERSRELFERVVKARDTLRRYVEELKTKEEKENSHVAQG